MSSRLIPFAIWLVVFPSIAQTPEADAAAIEGLAQYDKACVTMSKRVPGKLVGARKLAPLLKEVVEPDMDYCQDQSKCDLRTLVFKDFSIRLLHYKPTHAVAFHIGEFSNARALERLCGKNCVAAAEHNEKTGKYVLDCQQNI